MRVLVDSNVILDFLLQRKPFYDEAYAVHKLVEQQQPEGCISSSATTGIFSIAHKQIKDTYALYGLMDELAQDYTIAPVLAGTIKAALALRWKDFEDTVRYVTACESALDYIITRDGGFEAAAIPRIRPEEFFSRFKMKRGLRRSFEE